MNTFNQQINTLLHQLKAIAPNAELRSDSRLVSAGDIFFAYPVSENAGDGRLYIQNAIENGAAAVVFESRQFQWNSKSLVPHFPIERLASHLGQISQAWYEKPDQGMLTVAVTGTNGKTSCSQWIAAALSELEQDCAVIGTLGCGLYHKGNVDHLVETGFTTPDAIQLQKNLHLLKERGAVALAIEASSIGLYQERLNGLRIDIALFTNLTRDHLDDHGSFENYAAAKALLFQRPELQIAIINLDDEFGEQLVQQLILRKQVQVFGYSLKQQKHPAIPVIFAEQIRYQAGGTQYYVRSPFGHGLIKSKMIGEFNVSNMLGVFGVLLAHGVEWDAAVRAISLLNPVTGRMQQLDVSNQVLVVIDYAHTPDALEKALTTLLPTVGERHGELWCVFGCGGDRDPGKRPQMGGVASEIAHHVIVTSDNPRSENPEAIIQQILVGMKNKPKVIEDRAGAILYAIKHAKANDVILIAGKGHEAYQEINGKKWPFSDCAHAELALASVAVGGHSLRGEM